MNYISLPRNKIKSSLVSLFIVLVGTLVLIVNVGQNSAAAAIVPYVSVTDYQAQLCGEETATIWLGEDVAVVVAGETAAMAAARDQTAMAIVVNNLDRLDDLHRQVTGRRPLLSDPYEGRHRIEIGSCGAAGLAGHGALGYYVGRALFWDMYDLAVEGRDAIHQAFFYESARNYWMGDMNPAIDYHTSNSESAFGWWTVGFNNAAACIYSQEMGVELIYAGQVGRQICSNIHEYYTVYSSDPQWTWENSWQSDLLPWHSSPRSVNGLMSATLIELNDRAGSIDLYSRLYCTIPLQERMPSRSAYQMARDNFYKAASHAAEQDLYDFFANDLKWQITSSARTDVAQLAASGYDLPSSCLRSGKSYAYDSFATVPDSELDGAGFGRGWADNWQVVKNVGTATHVEDNLFPVYADLNAEGHAININHAEETSSSFLATRNLYNPTTSGEVWLSYRIKANKVGNGHVFVSTTSSSDSAIGKAGGSKFSIHNARTQMIVEPNETYLVVAKYIVNPNGGDQVYMWVNPDLVTEPRIADADMSLSAEIGTIDRVTINVNGGGQGNYLIDEIRLGEKWTDHTFLNARIYENFTSSASAPFNGAGGGLGWFTDWDVTANAAAGKHVGGSLSYGDLPTEGNAVSVVHTSEGVESFVATRLLEQKFTSGPVWLSYRVKANKVGNGHMVVQTSPRGRSTVGKAWGTRFAAENTRSDIAMVAGQTYWIVAKYVLAPIGLDKVYVWVNPNPSIEPNIADADVTHTASVGDIDRIAINVQDYGLGDYVIDEVRLDTNWANHVASQTVPTFAHPRSRYNGTTGDAISHRPALDVAANNRNFSVEYCLQPEQGPTGQWRAIVHKGANNGQRTFAMWLTPGSMNLHYTISTTSNGNRGGYSAAKLPLNQPTKVSYVRDGNQLKLYLNGVLDSSTTLNGEVVSNTGPLYIGDSPWYPGTKGVIGDFSTYDEAITPVAGSCRLSTFTHPKSEYDGATGDVVSHGPALDVAANNSDFSVEYCLQPEQGPTGQWRAIAHKGASNGQRTFAMWLTPGSMNLHYTISTTSNGNRGGYSAAKLPLNQPTKVSYVRDGNQLKLYLNGVLDSSTTLNGEVVSNTGPLYIGDSPWYPGTKGVIGDFSTYDGAITPVAGSCRLSTFTHPTKRYDGATGDVIAHSAALDVAANNNDFSVEYCLQPEQGPTGQWRAIAHKGASNGQRTFAMWLTPGSMNLHYTISTTSNWNSGGYSAAKLPLNQPTKVSYVRVGNKLRLYLNGVFDSSITLSGEVVSNTGPLYIGDSPWYPGTKGLISDFATYDEAITPTADSCSLLQRSISVQSEASGPQTSTLPEPNLGDQGASPGIDDIEDDIDNDGDINIDDNANSDIEGSIESDGNQVFIPFTVGQR